MTKSKIKNGYLFFIIILAVVLASALFVVITGAENGECKEHDYRIEVTCATLKADGKKTEVCINCGTKGKTTVIPQIDSVTLKKNKFTHDWSSAKIEIVAKDRTGKTLIKDVDYQIFDGDNDYFADFYNPGKYTAQVRFMGNYTGKKNFTIKIVPAKVTDLSYSKLRASSVKLSWYSVFDADNYTVYSSKDGKTWSKALKTSKTYATVKSLSKNTTYYFRVCANHNDTGAGPYSSKIKLKTLKDDSQVKFATVTDANGNKKSFEVEKGDYISTVNKAISYAAKTATDKNKCTVKLPKCTIYRLKLYDNVTYDLSSGVKVKLNASMQYLSSKNGGYSGLKNVTIKGGEFSTEKNKIMIRLAHCKNITFNAVKFIVKGNNHAVEFAACKSVKFTSCTFNGNGEEVKKSGAEAIQLDVLDKAKHFSDAAPYDGTVNDGISVSKCKFNNVSRGVGSRNILAGYYQKNITISSNTFQNLTSAAVVICGSTNVKITKNKVISCGEGIDFYEMTGDGNLWQVCIHDNKGKINHDCKSEISNNTISVKKTNLSSNPSGIYVCGNKVTKKKTTRFPTGDYYVGNLTLKNNTISTPVYGIRMFDTKNSSITANTITATARAQNAVYMGVNSDNNTLTSNKISGKFDTGLVINDSQKNVIKSNNITSMNYYGINTLNGAKQNYITYNTINFSGSSGINVYGATVQMLCNNTVKNSGGQGIAIQSNAKIDQLNSNTVTGSKYNGVYLDKSSSIREMKSNKLSGNKNRPYITLGKVTSMSGN